MFYPGDSAQGDSRARDDVRAHRRLTGRECAEAVQDRDGFRRAEAVSVEAVRSVPVSSARIRHRADSMRRGDFRAEVRVGRQSGSAGTHPELLVS
jgi:hypothetical protein